MKRKYFHIIIVVDYNATKLVCSYQLCNLNAINLITLVAVVYDVFIIYGVYVRIYRMLKQVVNVGFVKVYNEYKNAKTHIIKIIKILFICLEYQPNPNPPPPVNPPLQSQFPQPPTSNQIGKLRLFKDIFCNSKINLSLFSANTYLPPTNQPQSTSKPNFSQPQPPVSQPRELKKRN